MTASQPLLSAAENYAQTGAEKNTKEFPAARSYFETKAENFEADQQYLMSFIDTFEFREAGEDKTRLLEAISEKFDSEKKAWAYISGEDKSTENAAEAAKQLGSLFSRAVDAVAASRKDNDLDANLLTDFALALDEERMTAFKASLAKK